MLDTRFIFKEVEAEIKPATLKSFDGKKKVKKNRDGYSDNVGSLLFETRSVSEFLRCRDPITFLFRINALFWDAEAKGHFAEKTSKTIEEYFGDLKLISSKEAKELLKWRSAMRGLRLMEMRVGENRLMFEYV